MMGNEDSPFGAPGLWRLYDVLQQQANAFRAALGAAAALALATGGVFVFFHAQPDEIPLTPHRPFTYPVVTEPLTTTPEPATSPAPTS
ncbi:hypothetical protein [Nocardia sp. NPDC051832]|uniref:hypothetical protein n=1 Tax=Nocardia sp. NPDC051832 TaxID=3155673 RepID=UPI00342FDF3A